MWESWFRRHVRSGAESAHPLARLSDGFALGYASRP